MKFVILIIAGGLLYLLFKGDQRKRQMSSDKQTEKLKETGEMVKDPMCGSYCRADTGIRVREGDAVHVFCSYDCRDKYLSQRGIAAPTEASGETEGSGSDAAASDNEVPRDAPQDTQSDTGSSGAETVGPGEDDDAPSATDPSPDAEPRD